MKKLLKELFFADNKTYVLHHQSTCPAVSFQTISKLDQKAQKSLKEKFKHEWLTDKSLVHCSETIIWWLAYVEGRECNTFCTINTKNEQNKSKVFSSDPAVRYVSASCLQNVYCLNLAFLA